jgi:hypothetical protein
LGQELGRISEMSDCTLYDAVRTKTMGLKSVLVQCAPANPVVGRWKSKARRKSGLPFRRLRRV